MPENPNGDFDTLLSALPTEAEKSNVASLEDGGTPAPTLEQIRIRELEEQLAKYTAAPKAPNDPFHGLVLSPGDELTIHFLDDGLTANGRVWEKGQSVTYIIDGSAHRESKDRNGKSWLDNLTRDNQIKRWGRVRVGLGPYPHELDIPAEIIEEPGFGPRIPVLH